MKYDLKIFSQIKNVDSWWRLLQTAATNTVFQTLEFQNTWWETLGKGELHIVTLSEVEGRKQQNHELVGLAPFFIHDQTLKLVGCKAVSDYLDVIVNSKYIDKVYPLLADSIAKLIDEQKITQIELCSLPHQSATLTLLPKLIKQRLPTVEIAITEQDVCPKLKLTETFEQYLALLERKQRHEIKRKLRKLETEADYQVECVTEPAKILKVQSEFVRLHQLSSPQKHDFWTDEHHLFFSTLLPKLAEKGWLKLYLMYLTNWRENSFNLPATTQPVSAMLVFDYANTYSLYNSGYDPTYRQLSVGQVLTILTIEDAIKQGKHTYDFLRGREEYKFRLGGQPQPIYDLTISV